MAPLLIGNFIGFYTLRSVWILIFGLSMMGAVMMAALYSFIKSCNPDAVK
ncbi:MAG: hypothetical protein ACYCXQ_11890 [Candidatus Humimicrobiaceae bacterium]